MAGSPTKRRRIETERLLLLEPSTLDAICEDVSYHGSLGKWCHNHGVSYRNVHGWLHADPQRLKAYTVALEVHTARLTEKVKGRMELLLDADVRQVFTKGGKMKRPDRLPDSVAGAVSEIRQGGRGGDSVKLVPPDRAVELAGRHLGMFREKVDLEVSGSLSTRLAAARARASNRK